MGNGTDEFWNGAIGFEAQPFNPVGTSFKAGCEDLEGSKIVLLCLYGVGRDSDMMKTPALRRSSGWRLLKLPTPGRFGVGRVLKRAHCLPFYSAMRVRELNRPGEVGAGSAENRQLKSARLQPRSEFTRTQKAATLIGGGLFLLCLRRRAMLRARSTEAIT